MPSNVVIILTLLFCVPYFAGWAWFWAIVALLLLLGCGFLALALIGFGATIHKLTQNSTNTADKLPR